MSEKSEALRLAGALAVYLPKPQDMIDAAEELRRLSAVEAQRDALLEALVKCRDRFFPADQPEQDRDELWGPVNAAIKAVEDGE